MNRLILTTAALTLAAGTAMAADVVRIGTEGAYPPWNLINDAGEVDGFERELGDELCRRAELTCEWVVNDWDSIIPNLTSGNYDAIMAGMSITDEREAVIDFSQPYAPPEPSLYMAMSEDVDLNEAVIAVQTGTIQANYVVESGAVLVEFATLDESVSAVRNGEADAVLADSASILPIAEAEADMTVVGDQVFLGNGPGIGLRESDTELKEKFNAALQSMKDDGSLNELIKEWQVSILLW
ncbi:MAG: transporter substrate-binding domain-containing protein [Tropicimonas sp.]|uniref:transporter substrate-binding domain-containing protein n=1 Tax=Tropicimonas sp. TaxID=2067044 RepID=UPI003A8B0ACD